jgi:hypothetical protein
MPGFRTARIEQVDRAAATLSPHFAFAQMRQPPETIATAAPYLHAWCNPHRWRKTMMLHGLRIALAATLLALAAVSAVESASAGTAIEYGLIFGWP